MAKRTGRPEALSIETARLLLARGMTPDQIALEVGCSVKTVKRRIREIRTHDPSFETVTQRSARLAQAELVEAYDPDAPIPTPAELYAEAARATAYVLRNGTCSDKIQAAALVLRFVEAPKVEADDSGDEDLLAAALEASGSAAQARALAAANDG